MDATTAALMTASDLAALPDDDYRYELVAGQLLRDHPAGFRHGTIAHKIGRILGTWVEAQGNGVVCAAETGFVLRRDPDTVRAPDAAFVAHARIPADGPPAGYFDGAPDLAVEVLSPDDRMLEVLDKLRDWFDGGAQQVWVIAPGSNTVSVYRSPQDQQILTEADTLVGDGPAAGFRCAVRDIFA